MNRSVLLLGLILLMPFALAAEELPTISEKTDAMVPYEGFFDLYWDETKGAIWLEVDRWDEEFLYVSSLASGLGSNDIGLDRAQLGRTRIVSFQRVGPKVLLVESNYDYRATSENPAEIRAVEDAFATSVVWGFEVGAAEDGRVLVDASAFLLRDAHDAVGALKRSKQGTYAVDETRSALYLPRTKNFPENTEFEATLTFAGTPEGDFVRDVSPDPKSLSLRQHHSFVKLPDDGYEPRRFDPRAGMFPLTYADYGVPIEEPVEQRFVMRHRLEKRDPNAAFSEPVEPIVYYLDAGTPEPVRSALLEGAAWWNEAFEAIGFRDAFQVRLMPEGADPMDVRYNTITWVHRATRGWSYGDLVEDPRTGEIIKGHVTLGSLRVRQDFLIAAGLKALYDTGDESAAAVQLALARLRQLSAHEIGHTIGFAHNFAASTNARASVMDYPPPRITVDDTGAVSFEEAYATGIGAWDNVTVAYGYSDFPDGTDESEALTAILNKAHADGLRYISDRDARPPGGAHPYAHLWDDGDDAIDALTDAMAVRRAALQSFSASNLRPGAPLAQLEEMLVPVYLYHRYQAEAAVKLVGGVHYDYALRDAQENLFQHVAADEQRRALNVLLDTLSPEFLRLSDGILNAIPPRPSGYPDHRELFAGRTGPVLDPVAASEVAVAPVVALLLHPQRAERLVQQHARDETLPGLRDILDQLVDRTWKDDVPEDGLEREIQFAVDTIVLDNLLRLRATDAASSNVKEVAQSALVNLAAWLDGHDRSSSRRVREHRLFAQRTIERFLEEPSIETLPEALSPPPGSPIGQWRTDYCSFAH